MKKFFASILILLNAGGVAIAQSEFDALRYSQNDIKGTARYMSMGGAFGALGGDASSIHLNPAGLGVYLRSELSISAGFSDNYTSSSFGGSSSSENKFSVPFNNFAFVLSFSNPSKKSGTVAHNFGFTFNKLKSFNRNIYAKGNAQGTSITDYLADYANYQKYTASELTATVDGYEPFDVRGIDWLSIMGYESNAIGINGSNWSSLHNGNASPFYSLQEKGYINEWNFSYGLNVSHKFYFGASIGIQDMDYEATSRYGEEFEDDTWCNLTNYMNASGTGVDFKIGVIYKPVNQLRLGFSLHTPTFYDITEYYDSQMETNAGFSQNPDGFISNEYDIQGAMRYNFSAAGVIGKKAIISFDYGLADYTSMKLKDYYGSSSTFKSQNADIDKHLKLTHSFKVGAEYNLSSKVALRLGYALITSATEKNAFKDILFDDDTNPHYFIEKPTNYFSGGIGYRSNYWFLDLAYQLRYQNLDFYAFDSFYGNKPAEIKNSQHNLIATFGFKF